MAFCRNCGNELNDGAKFCPKCGSKTDNGYVAQQQAYQPPQEPVYETDEYEELKIWEKVICFLVPLCGFILFINNWREEALKAESALKYAFWGTVASTVFSLIMYWEGYCRLGQIITGKY